MGIGTLDAKNRWAAKGKTTEYVLPATHLPVAANTAQSALPAARVQACSSRAGNSSSSTQWLLSETATADTLQSASAWANSSQNARDPLALATYLASWRPAVPPSQGTISAVASTIKHNIFPGK